MPQHHENGAFITLNLGPPDGLVDQLEGINVISNLFIEDIQVGVVAAIAASAGLP